MDRTGQHRWHYWLFAVALHVGLACLLAVNAFAIGVRLDDRRNVLLLSSALPSVCLLYPWIEVSRSVAKVRRVNLMVWIVWIASSLLYWYTSTASLLIWGNVVPLGNSKSLVIELFDVLSLLCRHFVWPGMIAIESVVSLIACQGIVKGDRKQVDMFDIVCACALLWGPIVMLST